MKGLYLLNDKRLLVGMGILLVFFLFRGGGGCNKPQDCCSELQNTLADMDALKTELEAEARTNAEFQMKTAAFQAKIDTLQSQIRRKQRQIDSIKKQKDEEANADYSGWTIFEYSKFLSDRYPAQP
jgi:hypothetical protein